jgi:hypothetical protein
MFVLNHQLEFLTFSQRLLLTKLGNYQGATPKLGCKYGYDVQCYNWYLFNLLGLTTGELKFRLDNSWATNFGDDGNNLSLDAGGVTLP